MVNFLRRQAVPSGALVLLLAISLHLYWSLRFSNMTEWDTAYTTWTINSIVTTSLLVPDQGVPYWNGFTYQVLGASLIYWTGWDISYIQVAVSPFLGLLPVVLIMLLYREILPGNRLADLGVLLILLQADFLLITSRGSHEKYSLTLLAMVLLALLRAYSSAARFSDFWPWLLLFYLGVFALLATNIFFAGSFLATLASAALGAHVMERTGLWRPQRSFRPLVYTLLACLVIEFLLIFYLYPPIQQTLRVAQSMVERLSLLFLEVGERPQQVNPYSLASRAWVWPNLWVVLRIPDVLVVLTASLGWISLLRSKEWQQRSQYVLLLVFYAALVIQLAIAATSDRGGAQGIWNTQVRLFPVLILMGAPLSAYWLYSQWHHTRRVWNALFRTTVAATIPFLVGIVLIKATNEPVLSFYWNFFRNDERLAIEWLDTNPGLWSNLYWRIWAGSDGRLQELYIFHYVSASNRVNIILDGSGPAGTTYDLVMTSPVIEAYATLAGSGVPDLSRAYTLYDNGQAKLYDPRRPLIPENISRPRQAGIVVGTQ
ncbi:MAG: hypothetical protein NTZ05_21690 [Chloroflexi bacterium]|nr:hypothetical protein [Chloroflexota bacterium]